MSRLIAPRCCPGVVRGLLFCLAAVSIAFLWPVPAAAEPGILPFKPGVTVGGTLGAAQTESLQGTSRRLYAQVQLGRLGFLAEIAQMDYSSDERADRSIGGGMSLLLLSVSDVSLFVRGTVGVSRASAAGIDVADQLYGAAGGGVAVLLTRNLSVTLEALEALRVTARRQTSETIPGASAVPDGEKITNLRIGLAVSF